jgi:hypothetical protein
LELRGGFDFNPCQTKQADWETSLHKCVNHIILPKYYITTYVSKGDNFTLVNKNQII